MDIVSDPSLQRGAGGAGRDHPTARQRACRRRRSRPRPGYCRDRQCRVRCAWRARSQSADHARQPDRGDGIELMTVLHILSGGAAQGLVASLAPKFKALTGLGIFPNGEPAMRHLAETDAVKPIGCTQSTEIISTAGVILSGSLPPGCELSTMYTAAVTTRAAAEKQARSLIDLLIGADQRELRERAGFLSGRR